ncbi:unnamed protein product [Closterium sp. NIES-64]|nr:unnamed protein product [Closterium sp. NIES-64]
MRDQLILTIVVGSLIVLAVAILIGLFVFWKPAPPPQGKWKHHVDGQQNKPRRVLRIGSQKYTSSAADTDFSLPSLPFNDIQVATNNFDEAGTIEAAGYSSVHRGEGPDGRAWAVKRAKKVSIEGSHLFKSEVDFLSQVSHPNLLQLLAFCDDNNEQILVFPFMANGALSTWLRPSPDQPRPALTWEQRQRIAQGVALGLQYLHSFSNPTIIHRDVKSETILLDEQFDVKVGGLGLLKHLPGEAMRLRMARKKGYLDPEYFQTFKVTTKCDVYSFGVVLLELLTGKPPILVDPHQDAAQQGQAVAQSQSQKQPGKNRPPTRFSSLGSAPRPSATPLLTLPQWVRLLPAPFAPFLCPLHALSMMDEGKIHQLVDPHLLLLKQSHNSSPPIACQPHHSPPHQALSMIDEGKIHQLVDPHLLLLKQSHNSSPPIACQPHHSPPHQALSMIDEGKIHQLVDPRLPQATPVEELQAFARVAASCVSPLRRDRPDMPRVVAMLQDACRTGALVRFTSGNFSLVRSLSIPDTPAASLKPSP